MPSSATRPNLAGSPIRAEAALVGVEWLCASADGLMSVMATPYVRVAGFRVEATFVDMCILS